MKLTLLLEVFDLDDWEWKLQVDCEYATILEVVCLLVMHLSVNTGSDFSF